MRLKIYSTIIAGLFFVNYCFAQTTSIKGRVLDERTKESLIGVNVVINDSAGTVTNIEGDYELKVKPGKYDITFRYLGYETLVLSVEAKENETAILNSSIKEGAKQLGEVVISAGKFEQNINDLTVSMSVIKPALIENKCTVNMQTIVEQTPGVNVMDGQANIRGGAGFSYGAGSRVLIMVDDMPMLTGDAGDAKWNFLPIENLEQMEVIKGASSALYGSSALNGVINIRTAYPKDVPETKVQVFQGVYSRFNRDSINWWDNGNPTTTGASFFHSRKIGNFDLVLGGNIYNDEGYRKFEKEQRGRFNFNTRYRFKKIQGLSVGLNANTMHTRGGLFLIWQDGGAGSLLPSGGKLSNYTTYRTNIDPFVTYFSKKGDKIQIRSRFFNSTNLNDSKQNSIANLYYTDLQYQKKTKKSLVITTGVTTTITKVYSLLYHDHDGVNYAAYMQLDKKFFEKLNVSFGMRGEYFRIDNYETKADINVFKNIKFKTQTVNLPYINNGDTLVYTTNQAKRTIADTVNLVRNSKVKPVFRLGTSYGLTKYTFLRASFGQGYRFPTIAEKYIRTNAGGLEVYPNDSLNPETGWSAEFGIKQNFKFGKIIGYLDVAEFWTEYQNMMQFTFGQWGGYDQPLGGIGFKSLNIGQARISGTDIELKAGIEINKDFKIGIMGGYTYMNPINLSYYDTTAYKQAPTLASEDTATHNNVLKYRFKHMAKMDIGCEYKKFSWGISFRYNSFVINVDPIFESPFIPGIKEYRQTHNKGDYVFDARLGFKANKNSKVAVVCNNVLNREYTLRPAYIMPPRTVMIQYTLTF